MPSSPMPFLVGCGRSGTTLLRAMFDSHPQLAIMHESYFLLIPILRERRRYERGGFRSHLFVQDLVASRRFERLEVPEKSLTLAMSDPPVRSLADAIRCLFRVYADTRGKERAGDKSPDFIMHVDLLGRLFPEARFVHIVRDGRDVASSLKSVEWGPEGVGEAALYWKRRVVTGRRAGVRLGPSRYREVRYEDLVADPREVVDALCSFLELPVREEMFNYPDRATDIARPLTLKHRHGGLFQPPTAGFRDWRREMSEQDVRSFEAVAGGTLEAFGYERAHHSLAPSEIVAAQTVRLKETGRRIARRFERLRTDQLKGAR